MIEVRLGVYSLNVVDLIVRSLRSYSGPLIVSWETYVDDDNEVSLLVFGNDLTKKAVTAAECKAELVQSLHSYADSNLCSSMSRRFQTMRLAGLLEGTVDIEAFDELMLNNICGRQLNPILASYVKTLLDEIKTISWAAYRYLRMGLEIPDAAKFDKHLVDLCSQVESIRR
jgi:hypothetical protein